MLRGEDRYDAVECLGFGGVDPLDVRVRMWTAHDRQGQHSHELDVVNIVALACDETRVFAPLDAGAEDLGGHGVLLVDGIGPVLEPRLTPIKT